MKILVTGFGPFDRFSFNPSEKIVRTLEEEFPEVTAKVLPVLFGESRKVLLDFLETETPDLVISFGLNGRIGHIALEELALNISSSEVPDNSGRIIPESKVSENGEIAYRTLLPTEMMVQALREKGIPASRSFSAGTYLCNEIFYTVMEYCANTGAKGGFVHIPMATEMIAEDPRSYGMQHMSMEMLKEAGRCVLENSIG